MIIDSKELQIIGRIVRTAKVRAEYYEVVDDPDRFLKQMKEGNLRADLFTFLQSVADQRPRFEYHQEWDEISVLPLTTYQHWWKSQIKDKTRNMVRRASKNGVEVRIVEFDDALVRGIMEIYNESPVRQGKRFAHYGKDFETIKQAHATFLDRSTFIGAFFEGKLIGFIKMVDGNKVSNLMQILSKLSQRDKAPTNALIAKAVELCAEKGIPNLHYGMWSRGGIGDFKAHHGFQRVSVPRYFVPLNSRGALLLKFRLHHRLADYLPENWIAFLAACRSKWYSLRFREQTTTGQ